MILINKERLLFSLPAILTDGAKLIYCERLNIKDIDNFDIKLFYGTIPQQLRVFNKRLNKSYHCFDVFNIHRNECGGNTLDDVIEQMRIDHRKGTIDDLL